MPYVPRPTTTPVPNAIPKLVKKKHTFRVFSFLSTSAILLSIVSAVGVFAYSQISLQQLNAAKQTLAEASSVDTRSKVEELEIFHQKITTAQNLIDNHIASSKIFQRLEEATKASVRITSLDYTYDPGFQALLEVTASSKDYMSIALQNIAFLNNPIYNEYVLDKISSPSVDGSITELPKTDIENFELSENTNILFAVRGEVNKKDVLYTGDNRDYLQNFESHNGTSTRANADNSQASSTADSALNF